MSGLKNGRLRRFAEPFQQVGFQLLGSPAGAHTAFARPVVQGVAVTRMAPISIEECPDAELRATLEHVTATLGFAPNSVLTMQRVLAIGRDVLK